MAMALTAMLFAACSSEYPELTYVPDGYKNQNKEQVTIVEITPTLSYNTLFFSSATRGSNAFDNKNFPQDFQQHYLNSEFYILSYRRNLSMGELAANSDYRLLMNSANNADRKDCLVSTTTTSPSNKGNRGAVAMPEDMAGGLAFRDDDAISKKTIYWNQKYTNVGYDFFGYYLDDAVINNVSTTDSQIAMDVTFDGTQDLMVGKAPVVTRKMIEQNYPGIVETTTADTILLYGDGGYSTYGAIHGLQPKIEMQHCLTRFLFRFNLVDDKQIWIKDIRVKSQTNGTLVVAARNMGNVGFTPKGAESFVSMGSFNYKLTQNVTEMLGKGLMLPSKESYYVEIDFDEQYYEDINNTQLVTKQQTQTFTLTPGGTRFQAGTTYFINLSMYGAQEVKMKATLQKWEQGGVIDLPMQEF